MINGSNLNLLGVREPALYGNRTYADLVRFIHASACDADVDVDVFQSNHEGALVDRIQSARGMYSALIVNAAAYTHTSIAFLDALKAVGLPTVEVHLTDPSKREPFRRISLLTDVCAHSIIGHGTEGYAQAVEWLLLAYNDRIQGTK